MTAGGTARQKASTTWHSTRSLARACHNFCTHCQIQLWHMQLSSCQVAFFPFLFCFSFRGFFFFCFSLLFYFFWHAGESTCRSARVSRRTAGLFSPFLFVCHLLTFQYLLIFQYLSIFLCFLFPFFFSFRSCLIVRVDHLQVCQSVPPHCRAVLTNAGGPDNSIHAGAQLEQVCPQVLADAMYEDLQPNL